MRASLNRLLTRRIGFPVELSFSLSPRLLLGRLPHGRIVLHGARAGGLLLDEVEVQVRNLALVPSWPPRLRVASIEANVHVEQSSLDSWSKRVGLPVRLRLRPGRVVARTGIAGLRLSEADMDVKLEDRRLLLVPRRINVLGLEAAGSRLRPVALPLPQLPRDARLESLDPQESALQARLAVEHLDEPITRERIRAITKMASKVSTQNPRSDSYEDLDEPQVMSRPRTARENTLGRAVTRRSSGVIEATVLDVSETRHDDPHPRPGDRSE